MNKVFSLKRFKNLFVRDFLLNLKPMISIIGGSFFILLLISVLILLLSDAANTIDSLQLFYNKTFYIAFIFGALFVTGNAFRDFRKKEKTMHYLMLPSSTLEKVLSQYVVVTFVFTALLTLIYYIFSLLNILIVDVFTTYTLDFFEPFGSFKYWWVFLRIFIPSQLILLAGAVTFKKTPLFFTGLTYFLYSQVFWIISVAVFLIAFSGFDNSNTDLAIHNINFLKVFLNVDNPIENSFNIGAESFKLWSFKASYYLNQYILSILFALYIVFKVKEKQA